LQGEHYFTLVPSVREIQFNDMNTKEVKINWKERKERLKLKFASLTDNDLMFEEGKKEQMLVKLQNKLGMTKDELIKIIAAF
jgi:uncharacterized protein YjbJ (UPF0337 family)